MFSSAWPARREPGLVESRAPRLGRLRAANIPKKGESEPSNRSKRNSGDLALTNCAAETSRGLGRPHTERRTAVRFSAQWLSFDLADISAAVGWESLAGFGKLLPLDASASGRLRTGWTGNRLADGLHGRDCRRSNSHCSEAGLEQEQAVALRAGFVGWTLVFGAAGSWFNGRLRPTESIRFRV